MSSDAKLVADALRDCGMVQPALMIERRLAERESRGREHAADAPTSTKGDSYQAGSHPAPSTLYELRAQLHNYRKLHCERVFPRDDGVCECFTCQYGRKVDALIAALEAENARLEDELEEQVRAHLKDSQRATAAERKLEECAAAYKTELETTRHARGTAERERDEARAEINQAVEEAAAQRHAYVETATELANTKAELARLQPKPLDDEAMKQLAGYTREVYLRAGCGCEKQEHYEWPSAEGLSTWCGVVRAVLAAGAKP